MTVYLDTSAAARRLVGEAESQALAEYLDHLDANEQPASSMLLETELRRFAMRLDLAQRSVSDLLDRIELVEPDRSLFAEAGLLPSLDLRSLDAPHLVTALRIDVSVFVAYDHRVQHAARAVGLPTITPGQLRSLRGDRP